MVMNTMSNYNIEEQSQKVHSVIEILKKNWPLIQSKYLHHIRICVPLIDSGDFRTSAHDLNRLVRILVNNKQSIRNRSNRTWFSSFIHGGCYNIKLQQDVSDLTINVMYDIVGWSEYKDIDKKIAELPLRLRKVFPHATSTLFTSIQLNQVRDFESAILKNFQHSSSSVCLHPDTFAAYNKYLRRWLIQVLTKDIETFGTLYLLLHRPNKLA
jgi:hypothetical protein